MAAQTPPRLDGSKLVFAVRAVHAVTGQGLGPLGIALEETHWPGWTVIQKSGWVGLVASESEFPARPKETQIDVFLRDPHQRALVQSNLKEIPTPGNQETAQPGGCIQGAKPPCQLAATGMPGPTNTAPDAVDRIRFRNTDDVPQYITIPLKPAAMTIELLLVDEFNEPVLDAEVVLHPVGVDAGSSETAPAILLSQTSWSCVKSKLAQPGVYRSCPPRVWDARYLPFVIVVNGTRITKRTVDYKSFVTRHKLVVPKPFQ